MLNFFRRLFGLRSKPATAIHPAVAVTLGLESPVESPYAAAALLASAAPEDRRRGAHALGTFGDRRAAPLLLGVLGDADELVRICAIQSLGRLGETAAVVPLCEPLNRDGVSRLVTTNALAVLAELRDPRAVGPLTGLLKSPDPFVRFDAAHALGEIGHPDAIPFFEAVLTNATMPEEEDRGTMCSIGESARRAVEKIRSHN